MRASLRILPGGERMQRWQGAALALVLCTGCLKPLVDDKPGYSRYVMPAGTPVPSAYDDPLLLRKIDLNDGEASPAVPLKTGFAAGQTISYWDFGVAKRAVSPAYGIADCGDQGPVQRPNHPLIVDNVPGDTDYSAYRAILWGCATPKFQDEVVDSLDAFNDAIDLGLITDPTGAPATLWYNQPIVNRDVGLAFMTPGLVQPALPAYYRGSVVLFHDLSQQEGAFVINPMAPLPTNNVYELVKPGSMMPSRVIFSTPYRMADGVTVNPGYSPSWIVVTLTMKPQMVPMGMDANAALDALIATLTNADDLVTVGMNNTVTVKNTSAVASATVTTNRVNRAFYVKEPTP
ncbi:MAG: hypothetical protein JWN04_6141 [Myxococcaceae bacterium]|nr:hypothetical protein [Myxococcaceae bacterium]